MTRGISGFFGANLDQLKLKSQPAQPKAPPVYRPNIQVGSAPPAYRPNQVAGPGVQLSPAGDLRLEKRNPPPVYRPSPLSPVAQGKPGGLLQPIVGGKFVTASTSHHANHASNSFTIQPMRKEKETEGERKKREQKERKQRESSRTQSLTDRNINNSLTYETTNKKDVDKKVRGATKLAKQGTNIAHGSGARGSPVSPQTRGRLAAMKEEPEDQSGKQSVSSVKFKGPKYGGGNKPPKQDQQSSVPIRQIRTGAGNAARFLKNRDDAIATYINHCQRSELRNNPKFTVETFSRWAEEWAEEQTWDEISILSEHPTLNGSPEKRDEEDDDDQGGNRTNPGNTNVNLIEVK